MEHLVDTAHHDADTDQLIFIEKPKQPSEFNKILKAYKSRLDEESIKKRKYKSTFAD